MHMLTSQQQQHKQFLNNKEAQGNTYNITWLGDHQLEYNKHVCVSNTITYLLPKNKQLLQSNSVVHVHEKVSVCVVSCIHNNQLA